MPRARRALLLLVVALAASLLAGSCSDDAPLEGAEVPTPTAPPVATATVAPSVAPTASGTAPPLEPTASTEVLPREELPLIEFRRGDGSTVTLPTEVPPRSDYGIGLSGRYELDERGMLFYYADDERARGFYMRNTHVDLDIAFAGADFVVIAIRTMQAESLDIVRPEQGFQYAVEAPAGWYAAHGIAAGDRMRLLFELPEE